MSKTEWGVKRHCSKCDSPFYDMLRYPIRCPKCDAVFRVETGASVKRMTKSRVDRTVPKPAAGAASKATGAAARKAKAEEADDDIEIADDDGEVEHELDDPESDDADDIQDDAEDIEDIKDRPAAEER